ncbi:MAG TPA: SRPBCC domain-containing protein [Terriglobales bacterium]|nr:SRPBCC domain-containing protein [Terriglobales bacterium]
MATIAITPEQNTIHAEIFVAAPPERVFQALTDPSQMPRWWGQQGMYRVTTFEADVCPGGKWSSVGAGADGTSFRVDGEYLKVDPPRLLVHTWIPSFSQCSRTVVRWELEARPVHGLQAAGPNRVGTGTLVKLQHSGFAGDRKAAEDHANGWQRVLAWMQAFAEKGETVDTREPLSA